MPWIGLWHLSLIYLGLDRKIPNLIHHNYFLGSNFRQYADSIFSTSVTPENHIIT